MITDLRIDLERLQERLGALAKVGATEQGGCCRLALSDEDKQARDLVVSWMEDLGLTVTIDGIGNVVGTRAGTEEVRPVMTGSHIDTVRTGGRYDGNLGVLAGLEVIETLNRAGITTRRPLSVAFFTNEEGARFAPDMMGSLVFQGDLDLQEALDTVGIDGTTVRENLERIGYAGEAPCGAPHVHAFVELHIEQGPLLEEEGIVIGAVDSVQGISWTEVTIEGQSNHAGTTPMRLRRDAGLAAARLACFVRDLTREIGGHQVGTVGALTLYPNLVNVVARKAVMTVDLRNTDEGALEEAHTWMLAYLDTLSEEEGVRISHRTLADFEPVTFEPSVVTLVERTARALGHPVQRMPSGAGHDAQILARCCPAGMIFVPSRRGLSHNPAEFTEPAHLEAGANVLLQVLLQLSA